MSDDTNHAAVGLANLQADSYVRRKFAPELYAIACALERLECTRREIEGARAARQVVMPWEDAARNRIEVPGPDWNPGFHEIAMPAPSQSDGAAYQPAMGRETRKAIEAAWSPECLVYGCRRPGRQGEDCRGSCELAFEQGSGQGPGA